MIEHFLFSSSDFIIYGPVEFKEQSSIKHSLKTHGLVNKLNFSAVVEDAVKLSNIDVIAGQKRFISGLVVAEDVTVDGNVIISGTVNGLLLSMLSGDVLLNNGNQSVIGKKIFKRKLVIHDGLCGRALLNDINLKNAVVIQGRNQNIYGKPLHVFHIYVSNKKILSIMLMYAVI